MVRRPEWLDAAAQGIGLRLRGLAGGWAANLVCDRVAQAIAYWLAGEGDPARAISPDELERMAREGRPILTEMVARLEPAAREGLAQALGALVPDFGPERYDQVLDCLAALEDGEFRQHVDVLDRYPEWYIGQMEAARRAVFGA